MGFKQRGYSRDDEQQKVRDYSLFAIACEGTVREPEYFGPFNGVDRIKVDIIEDEENRNSAPKKVLERVQKYIEEVGLSDKDNDTLWCVIDVDRWPMEQITELQDYCAANKGFNLVISNPCFEVWLLLHKQESLNELDLSTAQKTKQELNQQRNGGYSYKEYLPDMPAAIDNAKAVDTARGYFPAPKTTKVYILAEALWQKIGQRRFQKLIASLK